MSYVIRFLIAVILGALIWNLYVLSALVAGIATVYYVVTERDWRTEAWSEFIPMIKSSFNELGRFVRTGNFS